VVLCSGSIGAGVCHGLTLAPAALRGRQPEQHRAQDCLNTKSTPRVQDKLHANEGGVVGGLARTPHAAGEQRLVQLALQPHRDGEGAWGAAARRPKDGARAECSDRGQCPKLQLTLPRPGVSPWSTPQAQSTPASTEFKMMIICSDWPTSTYQPGERSLYAPDRMRLLPLCIVVVMVGGRGQSAASGSDSHGGAGSTPVLRQKCHRP
jgi:hypothetical protein